MLVFRHTLPVGPTDQKPRGKKNNPLKNQNSRVAAERKQDVNSDESRGARNAELSLASKTKGAKAREEKKQHHNAK